MPRDEHSACTRIWLPHKATDLAIHGREVRDEPLGHRRRGGVVGVRLRGVERGEADHVHGADLQKEG